MDDLISRQVAIDTVKNTRKFCDTDNIDDFYDLLIEAFEVLPSEQSNVVLCKDCKKHNVSVGYQKDCCPLYEFRGMTYGHEHDYQYCCFAERKTNGSD